MRENYFDFQTSNRKFVLHMRENYFDFQPRNRKFLLHMRESFFDNYQLKPHMCKK